MNVKSTGAVLFLLGVLAFAGSIAWGTAGLRWYRFALALVGLAIATLGVMGLNARGRTVPQPQ